MANETKIIQIEVNHTSALNDIVQLQASIKQLTAEMKNLNREEANGQKAYAAKTVQVREYRAQLNSLVKESANEIKVHTEKIGYLEKLAADVSNLEKAYQRLSKAELDNKNVGGQMVEQLRKKRAELASAQAEYGKYSMNVGNYASATNMLAINVGQVMKEIPNFAISARIGIMSLTNNLPMLAEAIKAVRVQQAQMIAEGQKAPSMFSLISKSVFGLTGIMSIAMVLLQLYSGDIIKWIGNLFKGEEAVKRATKAQLGFKSAIEITRDSLKNGGEYKSATEQIIKMRASLEASKGSAELSKKALDDYNETLGVTFGKATDVDEALQAITKNETAYIEAMKNMTIANALFASSADDAVKIAEIATKKQSDLVRDAGYNYQELYDKVKQFDDRIKKLDETGATREYGFGKGGETVTREQLVQFRLEAAREITRIEAEEKTRQIGIAKKGFDDKNKLATQYYEDYVDIMTKNGLKVKQKKESLDKEILEQIEHDREMYQLKLDANALLDELDAERAANKLKAEQKLQEDMISLAKKGQAGLEAIWKQQQDEDLESVRNMMTNRRNYYSDMVEISKGDIFAEAEWRKKQVNQQMVEELAVAKLTEEQKLAIREKAAEATKTIEREKWLAVADMASSIASGLSELSWLNEKDKKFAAAAGVSIDSAASAYKTGAIAAEYFAAGNIPMGILASAQTGIIIAKGLDAINKIYAVDTSGGSEVKSASGKVTGSVTEKFHTGTYRPASQSEEKEITRTLLTTERVLSPAQTGIFDSIINRVQSLGGSSAITANVGVSNAMQAKMMELAMSSALRNMKAPVMSWSEFQYQADRMRQLEQNKFIR